MVNNFCFYYGFYIIIILGEFFYDFFLLEVFFGLEVEFYFCFFGFGYCVKYIVDIV